MDRIYSYRLDTVKGRLTLCGMAESRPKTFPRYAAFHPKLPLVYVNHEFAPFIGVYAYETGSGKLGLRQEAEAVFSDPGLIDGKPVGAQDILVSPGGGALYCSLVGVNSIAVFNLDIEGSARLTQVAPCGGNMPRGLQLSPDGRFLFCGNMLSGDITRFRVFDDGSLSQVEETFKAVSPSALRFII
jgi:6-phosphogluconolactonase